MERDPTLQAMLDQLAVATGNLPQAEAAKQRVCARCKKPVGEFRDEVSAREYQITGFCQGCQDWVFQLEEEEW